MAKIVPFKKRPDNSFEELLKNATRLKSIFSGIEKEEISRSSSEYYKSTLMNEIIKRKMIDKEIFLCALYVSEIMEKFSKTCPEHWYVVDYMLKSMNDGNKEEIKKGADYCFMICTFFPGRTDYGMMKKENYVFFGRGLYLDYYKSKEVEIAYLMAEYFLEMSDLSSELFVIQ